MTWVEVGRLTDWATQAPLTSLILTDKLQSMLHTTLHYLYLCHLEWLEKNMQAVSYFNFLIISFRRGITDIFSCIHFPTHETTISYLLPFLKPSAPQIPLLLSVTVFTSYLTEEAEAIKMKHHRLPPLHLLTYITVDQCFLKPGLQASSISTIRELVRGRIIGP